MTGDPGGPTRERIPALDVLRGVAVAGILFANVLVFFGLVFLPRESAAALAATRADRVAEFAEHVLVDGKFYSIFSLLFGIGFGVQLARGGDAVLRRFRRRLRILLAIGALHAFLLWAGDILMLYALLGFTLPWIARKPDRALVRCILLLFALPTALYALAVLGWAVTGPHAAAAPAMPARIQEIFAAVGTGGVKDAFVGNLVMVGGRWASLFFTVRFPKVLGMFVLGLLLARRGIALDPASHRATLLRWSALGLLLGLPANLVAAWAELHWPYESFAPGALLGTAMQGIGVPLLALGYAASVALLVVDGRRLLRAFGPLGRMALTNYLTHSLVCVTLSYGFGFGLWWRIGAARVMGIAAAILAVQLPLSAWWLSRFRFGPVEWIWRRLTYRQAI